MLRPHNTVRGAHLSFVAKLSAGLLRLERTARNHGRCCGGRWTRFLCSCCRRRADAVPAPSCTVWEFARKGVFGGYSASKLLPTDPPQFEDCTTHERYASLESVPLPEHGDWVWETDWQDAVPWEYAWNVTASTWKPKDVCFDDVRCAFARIDRWGRRHVCCAGSGNVVPPAALEARATQQGGCW